MRSLLDDLRRVPTPESVKSRDPLVATVKGAQLALLRAAIKRSQDEETNISSRVLRNYALWLEQAAFVHGSMDESVLETAATLYEFAANLTTIRPSTIFRPPLNDWLRSAIAASQAPFQGRASVIARRIDDYLADHAASSPVEQCHLVATRAVVALLSRKFHDAYSHGRVLSSIERDAKASLQAVESLSFEHDQLDLAVRIGHACAGAAAGMLAGVPILLEASIKHLADLREAADTKNDSERFWLADRLCRTVERMNEASMHRRLGYPGSPIPPRYRHMLAREGFLELWGPQLEALNRGMLDLSSSSNFVISIPTGAGKTLLAELLILSTLGDRSGWATYITPSRSLVNQASQELRRRLGPCGIEVQTILAGAEQSVFLEQELALLPRTKSLVVTTPEKLDTYYRNARHLFDSCRLLIVDEAHKVADAQRGPLLESLIARFLVLQPKARIALLSGVMSNPEEFDAWLGHTKTETIATRRRPTRHTFGLAVRQAVPLEYGDEKHKKDKKTKQPKTSRRVDFRGGLVVVDEDDDIAGDITVDLPDVFRGHFWERLRWNRWVPDWGESGSAITSHAVQIAQALAPAPGTILVFLNNTTWVESSSRKFTYIDQSFERERRQLAEFLSLELGKEHGLPDLCLRGVAYHHARLPASVQRAIELALERGWLKAVFATATLREGINTPATTVIVAGVTYRGKTGSTQMSAMDFANLAGRAGRPRADTEGRVILVPDSLAEASAIEAGREYVLSGEAARKVRTQLRQLKEALEKSDGEITQMPINPQRVLLSLKAADLTDEEGIGSLLDSTLWALQETDQRSLPRIVSLAVKAFVSAEERIGQRLALASKVGLSLTSSESLRDAIVEELSSFERPGDVLSRSERDPIVILLKASLSLEEIKGEIDKADAGVEKHLGPLLAWINGDSYDAVLAAGKESGLFAKSARVSAAVNHCTDFSNWLSWSFGAAWAIIEAELEDPDPAVGVLPLLVRYGVPTAAGAFVSLLGVADRNAALVLSRAFEETGLNVTLQSVSDWMQSVDIDSLFPPETHHLRAELLRRQAFRGRRPPLPYEFAGFTSNREVAVGTTPTLSRIARQVFVLVDDKVVGQVVEEELPEVLYLMANASREPYVVVVTAATPDQPGSFVIIQ